MSYITGTVTKHFMGWALSQDDFEFYLPWFMEDGTRTTRDWVEAQKERYRSSVSNPRTPPAVFWGLDISDNRSAEEKATRIQEIIGSISVGMVETEFRAFLAYSTGGEPIPVALTVINILDRRK